MLRLIGIRVASAVPAMLVVVTLVFLLLRLNPGDPATIMAGDSASPEMIARMQIELGLDRPIPVQYVVWLSHLLRGDLGSSILSKQPVATLILDRLEPTLELSLGAILITVLFAVPLGAIAAWRRRGLFDRAVMTFCVIGFSIPTYVVGYILILVFAMGFDILPAQGYVSPFTDLAGAAARLLLPSISLSLILMALVARVTRSSVLDIANEEFIKTARAKGNSEARILWRHALPNAAIPIATVIGLGIALLISGAVVTESVFNIPGIGRLTIDAILSRDYPVVQALILFFAFVYVVVNLGVDILYVVFDPRISY